MSIEALRRVCERRPEVHLTRDESVEDYECDCGATVAWDGVTTITCPKCGQVFEPPSPEE